jgi:inositol phosphorylceramide mannosyltransferase catalytic subunit
MKSLVKLALKIRGSLNRVGDYNFTNKRDIGNGIPKIIHQTYHSKILPLEIQENVHLLKAMNPDWEHRVYDDDDITNYINTNYPELLSLYNKINPVYGAAKADFFRYVLIYNEGGIYLDIKSSLSKPLNEVLTADDRYLLCHWQNEPGGIHKNIGFHSCIASPFGEFQQWHIAAVKGHPFLKAVIENVCNNIQNYNPFIHDTGGWSVVNLTGPIAYSLAIEPLVDLYPHRLERDNSKFGFIYSIFESKGIGLGHHKILKKHYTQSNESLIILPFAYNLAFKIASPFIKLIKNILIKLR